MLTSLSLLGCGVSDYACQCGAKRVAITTSATPCVLGGCSSEQALGMFFSLPTTFTSTDIFKEPWAPSMSSANSSQRAHLSFQPPLLLLLQQLVCKHGSKSRTLSFSRKYCIMVKCYENILNVETSHASSPETFHWEYTDFLVLYRYYSHWHDITSCYKGRDYRSCWIFVRFVHRSCSKTNCYSNPSTNRRSVQTESRRWCYWWCFVGCHGFVESVLRIAEVEGWRQDGQYNGHLWQKS